MNSVCMKIRVALTEAEAINQMSSKILIKMKPIVPIPVQTQTMINKLQLDENVIAYCSL